MSSCVPLEDRISFCPLKGFSPIFLDMIGHTYPKAGYYVTRTNFKYYVFEYIIAGKGVLRIEQKRYTPETGDVYIIPAYTEHAYYSDDQSPWDKIWFNVGGPLIQSLLSNYGVQDIVLFKHVPQKIKDLFTEGIAALQKAPVDCLKLVPHIMLNIIMELAIHHRNMEEKISPAAAEIRELLIRNISNPDFSIADMERQVHYSRSQILRIFEQHFKEPPYQYLLNLRIEYAKHLLKDPQRMIKDIGLSLGFMEPFYFSRLFKRKTGLSPMEYRTQELRKQQEELVLDQPIHSIIEERRSL